MYSKYTKRSTPERMKGSVFASYIWGCNPKLTIFTKNSPQNRSFYQIKLLHGMHSCDITILLEKLYFTTSNNLAKNLCVANVSSYSTSSLKIRKKGKKKWQKTSILGQIPISQMPKSTPSILLGWLFSHISNT